MATLVFNRCGLNTIKDAVFKNLLKMPFIKLLSIRTPHNTICSFCVTPLGLNLI